MKPSALFLFFFIACSPSLAEPSTPVALQQIEPPASLPPAKPTPQPTTTANQIPTPKAGADLIGKKFPLDELTYVSKPSTTPKKAYLVRWWTDTCPYCEATLPAIDLLRETYASKGLETIAVYHPKPPKEVSDKKIEGFAKERKYNGTLAADLDWSLLEKIWLKTGDRDATSVTFLVDAKGTIRFLHPGPEYHPSTEKSHADCNEDFLQMKQAIEILLAE